MNKEKHIPSLLPKQWPIPEIFRERLGSSPGKQRIMSEEDHYLIILHQVPTAKDRGLRKAALFWINNHGEWKSTPESGGVTGLTKHLDSYLEQVRMLENQLESASGSQAPHILHEIHDHATPLFRAARHLLSIMQELRDTFPDSREILLNRDTAITIERSAELLLADAKSSLEFLAVQNSIQQAQEAHKATLEANRLNRLAALFFPVITIASILSIEAPQQALNDPLTYFILIIGLLLGIMLLKILKTEK